MQTIPMCDLKNTAEVERRCAEAQGPALVTPNGDGRLMVISIARYDKTMREIEEARLLMEAIRDVKEGRMVDGDTVLKRIHHNDFQDDQGE